MAARPERPVAIAVIGVLGNVGGVLTPIIVGPTRALSQRFTLGFLITAFMMALGGVIAATLRARLTQPQVHRFGLQAIEE